MKTLKEDFRDELSAINSLGSILELERRELIFWELIAIASGCGDKNRMPQKEAVNRLSSLISLLNLDELETDILVDTMYIR